MKYNRYLQKIQNNGGIEYMFAQSNGFQPYNCKSGHDFELWVQGILTTLGFDAKLTGGSDNGVDIIATITVNDKCILVSCYCIFITSNRNSNVISIVNYAF